MGERGLHAVHRVGDVLGAEEVDWALSGDSTLEIITCHVRNKRWNNLLFFMLQHLH